MKTEAALPVEAPRLTALSIDSIAPSPHNPRHFLPVDAKPAAKKPAAAKKSKPKK